MKKVTCLLLCVLLLLMTASQTLASVNQASLSAETLLGNLAQAKKTERTIGGVTATAFGVGTGIFVSSLSSNGKLTENDVKALKTIGYFGAGVLVGSGIIALAMPSEAENHYRDVKIIEDPLARENAAYSSLVFCAEKAKRERLINGAVSAAAALYFLFSEPNYYYETNYYTYNGLLFAAGAGASFLVKSVEEKMLDQYHQGRGFSENAGQYFPNLKLSWSPNGRVTAAYSYQF
ncbi:MAG: hypothetical protein GX770_00860 [Firmicutes bacterium]|nr:hypothetical protein [Bacillota bacterium]